jgi:GT2 family glycosyltransferase
MDVSIIVVAWNVRGLLRDCLDSVYAQTTGIEFEVIYVDNGSSDGSVEMVRSDFPNVRIIENPDNRGFIKANNQAIEIARGRYVLLLNSDTVVLDNAIAKSVRFADQHADAAVVGCRVLNPDRSLQGSCFRFYSTLNMLFDALFLSRAFPRSRLFGRKLYSGWQYDSVRQVDVVIGCFSLVRMEAVRRVGVMDETFFVYGDDIDWCYRFAKAGWKVLFTPDAEIIHYGGQTTRKAPGRFALQLYGAYLINVKKHYSSLTFLTCRVLTALYFLLRAPYWSLRGLLGRDGRMKAFASARTFFTGAYFCLFDWKRLLMNRKALQRKL